MVIDDRRLKVLLPLDRLEFTEGDCRFRVAYIDKSDDSLLRLSVQIGHVLIGVVDHDGHALRH